MFILFWLELAQESKDDMAIEEKDSYDFKQVHRTEPVLERYNFDPDRVPAMSAKNSNNNSKKRFGLPREKVRKFIKSMKNFPTHSWHKVPMAMYV